MNGSVEPWTAIGIFLAGLFIRLGVFLAAAAALLALVLLLAGALRALRVVCGFLQGYRSAGTLRFRSGLRYAPGHTWLRAEGETLRIGLDDLAGKLLPWAVAVDLPLLGQKVREGEPAVRICCGRQEARVAAPVCGTVVAVNAEVVGDPTLLKTRNYGRGWLFAVAPEGRSYMELPSGKAARTWLLEEGKRLGRFYEQELGLAAADGGEVVAAPQSLLVELQWGALLRAFLRT
jgi:glycine cleavage system H lipoate-binding protein